MNLTKVGYGQVEFNHMSGPRDGRVYASLPAADEITQLENGQFAYYDYNNGEVTLTKPEKGITEPFLVYNEVKLYEPYYRESYKDFVWKKAVDAEGKTVYNVKGNIHLTPRLIGTVVGDTYTTNCFAPAVTAVAQGDLFVPGTNGYLEKTTSVSGTMVWQAVKLYTMPDGQPGVKLQRIK